MREKTIEARLVNGVKKIGGLVIKLVSPSMNGLPDRMVCASGGHITFIELKAPGKTPRPLQLQAKRTLERLGFQVLVIDSIEGVDQFLEGMRRHGV